MKRLGAVLPSLEQSVCSRRGCLLALVLILGGCDNAQLTGTVVDNFGHPLDGVSISVAATDIKTTTDSAGQYILKYAPGRFSVTYQKSGYFPETTNLDLSTPTKVPMAQVILVKTPPQGALSFVTKDGYVQINTCRTKSFNRMVANSSDAGPSYGNHTVQGVVLLSGVPTDLPTDGPMVKLVYTGEYHFRGNDVALYKTDENKEFWMQDEIGPLEKWVVHASVLSISKPSTLHGNWYQGNIPSGTYIFTERIDRSSGMPADTDGGFPTSCYIMRVP